MNFNPEIASTSAVSVGPVSIDLLLFTFHPATGNMPVRKWMSKFLPSCVFINRNIQKTDESDESKNVPFLNDLNSQSDKCEMKGDILNFERQNHGEIKDGNECDWEIFLVKQNGGCDLQKYLTSGNSRLHNAAFQKLHLAADGQKDCARLLDILCEPSSRFEQAMLSRSSMGDDVALRLAKALAHGCISIHSLLLPQNGITASGARWLSVGLRLHGQLRVLDLSYNCCSDDGAESLALLVRDSPGLRTLRLRGNGVGPRGATALAAALSTTSSVRTSGLEQLDLSLNCLRDAGATALASALSGDCTLRELDVSRSMVTAGGSAALATAMQRSATLQRLCVRATAMSAEEAAALEGLRRKCMDGARGTM